MGEEICQEYIVFGTHGTNMKDKTAARQKIAAPDVGWG
jgi:hypothetical protein